MRFRKSILLFEILAVFLLLSVFFVYSDEIPCTCGVYKVPFDLPVFSLNYIPLSATDEPIIGRVPFHSCNISCRDEASLLIDECKKEGQYYAYMDCVLPAYMSITPGDCTDPNANDCQFVSSSHRWLRKFFLEDINFDTNQNDCVWVQKNDPNLDNSNPVIYTDLADQGNGCCGDDGKEDVGYMADESRYVCLDDSENFPNEYQWLLASQNWFKISTVNRSETENPAVYDVVSNSEKWFICDPGVSITGPTYTVEVIPQQETLSGTPGLIAGVIASTSTTLGGLQAPVLQAQAPSPATAGSAVGVVDISTFGSDFVILDQLTTPTADNDFDGDGYIDVNVGGSDCNDQNPMIYPGAYDPCGDAVDQDCDGQTQIGPDGRYCQPVGVTFSVPDLASRFMCFNEDEKGTFAECCGYDMEQCYNEIPKGRRQGNVLTTIEEFQEGCPRTSNCVLKFGLIPNYDPYYSYNVEIAQADSKIHDWTDYESLEFFIYLSDDFVQDIIILGQQTGGTGSNIFQDYELLFYQPITKYAVNTISLGKWMHVVIPLDDLNWIEEPSYVSHILFYADAAKVRAAGGRTQTVVGDHPNDVWENIVGIDRIFLRPETTQYCTGTDKPKWIEDLDNNTKEYEVEGTEFGKAACQTTPTFAWTGNKCCGDDTTAEEQEYFSDALAGCWKGNPIPQDQTVMNVEYELSYNVPTYQKTFTNIPAEFETEEFEYTLSSLRYDGFVYGHFFGDAEINLSQVPKTIGNIGNIQHPEVRWAGTGTQLAQLYIGDAWCSGGVAIGAQTQNVYVFQTLMCKEVENIVVTPMPTSTYNSECWRLGAYAVCAFSSWNNAVSIKGLHCCPILYGASLGPPREVVAPQAAYQTVYCNKNEVVCGGKTVGQLSLIYGPSSIYCCPLIPNAYSYLITDDSGNITTSFQPSSTASYLSTDPLSQIRAVSDITRIKTPAKSVFEADRTGSRRETRRFTQTCFKNECDYPLVGEPPYDIDNLHPDLYDITVDENKSLIKVTKIRQEIIFYNGTFYGCGASGYIINIDPDVSIDNSPQMCAIVGSHFCSPNRGWNNELEGAPNASSRNTTKSTPEGYSVQETSCCPPTWCWNSTACIPDESYTTELINPLIEGDNVWRCLNGNWSLSILRHNWDYTKEGFCPSITQCLVDPTGNVSLNNRPETYSTVSVNIPQCIETGQFIEDHYCINGTWTSRTKLIALQLLDIVEEAGDEDNYTLFCDNYTNSLGNYDYLSIENYLRGREFAMPPLSIYTCSDNMNYAMPCVNNFCVLKYTDRTTEEKKVLFGTSLNRDVDDVEFSFLRTLDKASDYCSDLINTSSDFTECSNDPNIWYSDEINSIIFSKIGVTVGEIGIFESFARFITNPIRSVINYVVDIIAPRAEPSGAVINYNFTKDVKDFNQIYINNLYGISIRAIIEEPQKDEKFITIRYEGVPEDVCLAVDTYDKANPPDGQISCTKENETYYIISDQEVAFDVWTDFTSKLRPVSSP